MTPHVRTLGRLVLPLLLVSIAVLPAAAAPTQSRLHASCWICRWSGTRCPPVCCTPYARHWMSIWGPQGNNWGCPKPNCTTCGVVGQPCPAACERELPKDPPPPFCGATNHSAKSSVKAACGPGKVEACWQCYRKNFDCHLSWAECQKNYIQCALFYRLCDIPKH